MRRTVIVLLVLALLAAVGISSWMAWSLWLVPPTWTPEQRLAARDELLRHALAHGQRAWAERFPIQPPHGWHQVEPALVAVGTDQVRVRFEWGGPALREIVEMVLQVDGTLQGAVECQRIELRATTNGGYL